MGRGLGEGEAREGDQEAKTTGYKRNKVSECNVQHRDYNKYFITTFDGV